MLISLAIAGCNASKISNPSRSSEESKDVANSLDLSATKEDVNLYRRIGINYICIARQAEVDFSKALAIASTNFAALIEKKHGGLIEELGDKQLSRKQIYNGSQIQLLEGAIAACPTKVPDKDKDKFQEFLDKLKDSKDK